MTGSPDLKLRTHEGILTAFFSGVVEHVRSYVVPQYGEYGEDLAHEYSAEDCIKQAEKYLKRFGRSSRPGERQRDLRKAAHYLALASEKLPHDA